MRYVPKWSMRLSHFLERAAATRPKHLAIRQGEEGRSFDQLHEEAKQLARHLAAAGARPGERVVVLMENSIDFAIVFWAVQCAGAVFVPIDPATPSEKLAWLMRNAAPRVVVADRPRCDAVAAAIAEAGIVPQTYWTGEGPDGIDALLRQPVDRDLPAPAADALAAIIYTSGSTSDPKGVMLSQRNMVTAACSVASYLGYDADDRIFCAIPFTFDYGLHQVTMSALARCTLIVERSFAQPIMSLHRLATLRATVFPLVPTMAVLSGYFAGRFDLSSVRLVTSTAAAFAADVIDQMRAMFPQARVFSMYGLTECHRCTYLDPAELDRRKTSIGKAIPLTEMWVVDGETRHHADATGELVIRGDTVMQGYWHNPEATAERLRPGDWPGEMLLYTGDICRLDAEGFAYFIGRKDEILKVRGEKVAPAAVESVLAAHPDVALAAIVGRPDPVTGTAIVAFVEPRPGCSVSAGALADWCKARLAARQLPAEIRLVPALAKSPNGKIDKHVLKQRAAAPARESRQPRELEVAR